MKASLILSSLLKWKTIQYGVILIRAFCIAHYPCCKFFFQRQLEWVCSDTYSFFQLSKVFLYQCVVSVSGCNFKEFYSEEQVETEQPIVEVR